MILDILEVLIMPNGGAKLKGELFINDVVHCIGEWTVTIKNGELISGKQWTIIVHWDRLQDTIVDGVVLAVGGLDFCFGRLNGIRDEGGNNEAIGGWIRDEDLVELFG